MTGFESSCARLRQMLDEAKHAVFLGGAGVSTDSALAEFRSRKEGDYVTLPDGGRKTVARLMIDDKIPREDRSRIPVLAEGHHVLWVVGNRISEYYKITDQTRRVLQVVWNGGEEHGR